MLQMFALVPQAAQGGLKGNRNEHPPMPYWAAHHPAVAFPASLLL